jgi:hypothetical protein
MIGAEELAEINSHQTLSADTNSKSYQPQTKLKNEVGHIWPSSG